MVSKLATHQGSLTHIPPVLGTFPTRKPQIQQQTLLGKPSKWQVGLRLSRLLQRGQTPAGAAAPLERPAKGSGATRPPLPLLILSLHASMCQAPWGRQHGSSHHASGSWVKLISSTHASSPTPYLRGPELGLDNRWSGETWRGSAPAPLTPVSPRDRLRLELARARENASSCL